METVCILWHLNYGDEKLIGVYASEADTKAAVDRLKDKPGFKEAPEIIQDLDENGFMIGPYELGKDHWTEGFV